MVTVKPKQYSLHHHVTALTIGIMLLIVLPLGAFSYLRGSELIISSSDQIARGIAREAGLTFSSDYQAVSVSVELLSDTDIGLATTTAQRLHFLPLMTTMLDQNPAVSAVMVGYHDSNEFFIVRNLARKQLVAAFSPPHQARYIADMVSIIDGERKLRRYFFDEDLKPLGAPRLLDSDYQVKLRPWFKLAWSEDQLIISPPYRYYFIDQIGLTVAKKTAQGNAVFAADITLKAMSENLASQPMSKNSEKLIFDGQGKVLAYRGSMSDQQNSSKDSDIASIEDLGSDLLRELSPQLNQGEQRLDLSFQGQVWQGTVSQVYSSKHLNMFFAQLSPQGELLQPLISMRTDSALLLLGLLVIILPLSWWLAGKLTASMRQLVNETKRIARFDFSPIDHTPSSVAEINNLNAAILKMKNTLNQFLDLTVSLATEQNYDALLEKVIRATMKVSEGRLGAIYLYQDDDKRLELASMLGADFKAVNETNKPLDEVSYFRLKNDSNPLVKCFNSGQRNVFLVSDIASDNPIQRLLHKVDATSGELVVLPLKDRFSHSIGVLIVLVDEQHGGNVKKINFLQRLSGFSAVSIESRRLLQMQKDLLESVIELIAGAIDAKSPYTGGHCQRVPELTKMIVTAACEEDSGIYANYQLSEQEWEAIHIGAWLHDCGKVSTPEFVVDKATKLETIYDRLHEVRMRFEVLKRDAEIAYLKQPLAERDRENLLRQWQELDDDFAFIANCNLGSESMGEQAVQRLKSLSERTWQRTLADNIGLSWEETQRSKGEPQSLPVCERLLLDKPRHLIDREKDAVENQDYGFNMTVPALKYNRGELYNLSVKKGTLTKEERYIVNAHMVHTITMLKQLPLPAHLSDVPEIAGGHHETMIGTGYPRGLKKDEMPESTRMMAIADIFEALTASDRPYKTPKTLSEALTIMAKMADRQHIDGDIFELFVRAKVYLQYGERYLSPEQMDTSSFVYHYQNS